VKDVADIHGFNGLRWDDQQKIKAKMSGTGTYLSLCHICVEYIVCLVCKCAFVFSKRVTMSPFDQKIYLICNTLRVNHLISNTPRSVY